MMALMINRNNPSDTIEIGSKHNNQRLNKSIQGRKHQSNNNSSLRSGFNCTLPHKIIGHKNGNICDNYFYKETHKPALE
jgi:hypothetical protein